MKTMRNVFCLLLLCLSTGLSAQQMTQTLRGQVLDQDTKFPLPGAQVQLISNTEAFIAVVTDLDGKYRLENVPLGKQSIKVTLMGYEPAVRSNLLLTSAKEFILDVEMGESAIDMEDVVITAKKKGEVNNEMATISVRSFTVEETDRYAGSRGDPARMASNFAGVQGADDSRNDIVVRGNSPLGTLWRLDGVDIPNPSHFAIPGSQGGPTSILNNKTMSNSDFFTGAFPAEYGNSTSSVFDLKLRRGNNEKHEFSAQFGVLGAEIMGEGPLNKEKGSSYLAIYRYASLEWFQAAGLDIGTNAVPKYMDGTFKLNFPQKGGGSFSVFGVGGKSKIDIVISEQEGPEDVDLYGENDRDQYFGTSLGVVGANYIKPLNEKTFLRVTASSSFNEQHSRHEYIIRHLDANDKFIVDSIYNLMGYSYVEQKHALATSITKKINKKNLLKFGVRMTLYNFNNNDSILDPTHSHFVNRWDYQGGALLAQYYGQWRHKFSDRLTLNAGLQGQYFSLSNSLSAIEPRASLRWQFSENQSFNLGTGLHSQMQPTYIYTYHRQQTDGSYLLHNQNMDFTKSWHFVAGYDNALSNNMRLKSEVYHQQLFNVPVTVEPSAFSLINQGSGFARFFPDSLQNTGTGTNTGLELTLEKYFSKQFFFMVTGAVYDSKYKGSDGVERNTDYNGNYAVNFLFGKEFKVGEKNLLSLGGKVTYAGGQRYGIVDTVASNFLNEIVWEDDQYNELQFDPYFRADLKINFKVNQKKVSHEIALDLVNILGTQNILGLTYAPDPTNPGSDPTRINYQLGFLPIFYYKIDF